MMEHNVMLSFEERLKILEIAMDRKSHRETSSPFFNHRIVRLTESEPVKRPAKEIVDDQKVSITQKLHADNEMLIQLKRSRSLMVIASIIGLRWMFEEKYSLSNMDIVFLLLIRIPFVLLAFLGLFASVYMGIQYSIIFINSFFNDIGPLLFYRGVLKFFIFIFTPTIQIVAMAYTLSIVYIELHQSNGNRDVTRLTSELITICKRDSFYIFLPLTLIIIASFSWAGFSKTMYSADDDNGLSAEDFISSYHKFQFFSVCHFIFFYFSVTMYLSACMFFISLGLRETLDAQIELLDLLDPDGNHVVKAFNEDIISKCNSFQKVVIINLRIFCCIWCCFKESATLNEICCIESNKKNCSKRCFWIFCSTFEETKNREGKNQIVSMETTIDIASYKSLIEPTLKTMRSRNFSVQLFIVSAAFNTVSFVLVCLLYQGHRNTKYYVFSYCPFLLKEVLLFFYLLYKGTKINTKHDLFMQKLSEKILEFSSSDKEGCFTYANELNIIFNHCQQNPIQFTIFGYRISRSNFKVIFASFITSVAPLIIRFVTYANGQSPQL